MRDDWRLGACVMRPDRPRLAEARAVVIGLSDVREAWEALIVRGLVPAPWGAYDAGAFRGRATLGAGSVWQPATHHALDRGDAPTPPTIDDAVALASDPEGIAKASQHAAEFYARVRRWCPEGGPRELPEAPPPRAWSVLKMPAPDGLSSDPSLRALHDELQALVPAGKRTRDALDAAQKACGHRTGALVQRFRSDVVWALRWQMLVERDARQAGTGARYAEMPDPGEPLMEVWALGYAVGNLTPVALSMIAPAV